MYWICASGSIFPLARIFGLQFIPITRRQVPNIIKLKIQTNDNRYLTEVLALTSTRSMTPHYITGYYDVNNPDIIVFNRFIPFFCEKHPGNFMYMLWIMIPWWDLGIVNFKGFKLNWSTSVGASGLVGILLTVKSLQAQNRSPQPLAWFAAAENIVKRLRNANSQWYWAIEYGVLLGGAKFQNRTIFLWDSHLNVEAICSMTKSSLWRLHIEPRVPLFLTGLNSSYLGLRRQWNSNCGGR